MTDSAPRSSEASFAVYSPWTLRWYDSVVLGFSNRFVWNCPTRRLLNLFDAHVTGNHLDVGVGTGYFLDRTRFPVDAPRVVLLDANQHCLKTAARRIARYRPETVQADLFHPCPADLAPFDSISLNYVLHCLPGTLTDKAVVLDHLRAVLKPGGALFGSTLLSAGVPRSWLARRLMAAYNHKGIFDNAVDTLDELHGILKSRFSHVEIEVAGCAALFVASA